jgi:hypothetical protein
VCAEASTILRAVAADFFFNCWYLEIPSDNHIRHIPRSVHYRKTLYNKKQLISLTLMLLSYFPYFNRIDVGIADHQSVRVSVNLPPPQTDI